MANTQMITVRDKAALRRSITEYAAKGYATIREDGDAITLSRKKPFNWVLAIVLLFIPVIGWIALGAMLLAGSRGSQVVEISIDPSGAPS